MSNLNVKKIISIVSIFFIITACIFFVIIAAYRYINTDRYQDTLTKEEIDKISRSIVALQCLTFETMDNRGAEIFGSGTYLTIKEPINDKNINVVLTNSHVAENPHIRNLEDEEGICRVSFEQKNNYYFYNFFDSTISNDNQDFSLLVPRVIEAGMITLNENNNPLPFCNNITTGLKIYIFGYPGSSDSYLLPPEPADKSADEWVKNALKYHEEVNEYNKSRNLILSEGIISGKGDLGYFTTAKIDTGNSGGLVVAKEKGKICLVGIPTWVSIGEVDNLGVIQPIENIYQAGINWHKLSQKANEAIQTIFPPKLKLKSKEI